MTVKRQASKYHYEFVIRAFQPFSVFMTSFICFPQNKLVIIDLFLDSARAQDRVVQT